MSLLFIVQFLMGLSILVAVSRQTWAFSRDGALSFSRFFRPISQKLGYIPVRAIWGCAFLAAILGLLCLIAPAAAQALFSLAVSGNNLAWGVPIFARVVWGQRKFKPGPFYTGKRFSTAIAWAAVVFLIFGMFLSFFPLGGPNPTRKYFLTLCLHLRDRASLSLPISRSPIRWHQWVPRFLATLVKSLSVVDSLMLLYQFAALPLVHRWSLSPSPFRTFPTIAHPHRPCSSHFWNKHPAPIWHKADMSNLSPINELHRRHQLCRLGWRPGLLLHRRSEVVHWS